MSGSVDYGDGEAFDIKLIAADEGGSIIVCKDCKNGWHRIPVDADLANPPSLKQVNTFVADYFALSDEDRAKLYKDRFAAEEVLSAS